jgi:phosphate acetyltransferase
MSSMQPPAAFPRAHLPALFSRANALPALRTAIVYPTSAPALEAAVEARRRGLLDPVLVGPRPRIATTAAGAGIDLAGCTFVDTPDDPHLAAKKAVAMAREGDVEALMKGSLHTEDLLRPVIARHDGLRRPGHARRLSHVFWLDVPYYPRPLLATDCVINVDPSVATKRDIAQNAIDLARLLGIERPRLAVVSATENVNPAIQSTLDARALVDMATKGEISGGLVDGPFGFDLSVSEDAVRAKGIVSEVAGRADIVLLPGLEAGNIVYKTLVYLAHALCAGVVLGTRVPVILTSRADSIESRLASCAVALIQAHATRTAAVLT